VLTLTEAADLLRVEAEDVARLAERDELPVRRIGSQWRFSCAALMAWLAHDRSSSLSTPVLATVSGAGIAGTQAPSTQRPDAPDDQEKPVGEAPEERPAEDVFLRGQRVLLGRGEVVMDFGQFYSRNDSHLLVLADGAVGLGTLQQEAFTTVLVGRVGIFRETELFASTAFYSQRVQQLVGSSTLASNRNSRFGGGQVGVRRTLLTEGAGRPDIVVTASGQIPAHDMPYAASVGVVLVKSLDPVVLFASTNYTRAFSRDSSATAPSWAENSVDVSAGYGLALNDTVAISMSASGLFTGDRTLDDSKSNTRSAFSARFGLTSWLARGLYIEPSVSFGLTGPGSGFAFGLTIPYAF
jgi:excisionase family DNA binding protein